MIQPGSDIIHRHPPSSKRRGLVARVFKFVAVASMIVVAACAIVGWRMSVVQPTIAIDYEQKLQELESKQWQGEGINGGPLVMRLAKECDAVNGFVPRYSALWWALDWSKICDPSFKPENVDRAELEQTIRHAVELSRLSPMRGMWRQLRKADRYTFPAQGVPLYDAKMVDAGKCRKLARFNSARMFIAAESEDWGRFVEAYEDSLAVSRLVSMRGNLLAQLVSGAIDQLVNEELRRAMGEHALSAEVLDQIVDARRRQAKSWRGELVVQGERLLMLDAVQRTHTDDGKGGGTVLPDRVCALGGEPRDFFGIPPNKVKYVNFVGLFLPGREKTTAQINGIMDQLSALLATPKWRREKFALVEWSAATDATPKSYFLVHIVMPAWVRAVRLMDANQSLDAGTELMIAIEKYRSVHGAPPEALALLQGVSTIDPLTGTAFGYRRLDRDNDPWHRDYLLYSFGLDGTDDGGVIGIGQEMDAYVKGSVQGIDYVLNKGRPKPDTVDGIVE